MVSGGWSVGRGGDIRLGLGVDSGSLVGHISNISVIAVGGVLDVLDPDVGVNTLNVRSLGEVTPSMTRRGGRNNELKGRHLAW